MKLIMLSHSLEKYLCDIENEIARREKLLTGGEQSVMPAAAAAAGEAAAGNGQLEMKDNLRIREK